MDNQKLNEREVSLYFITIKIKNESSHQTEYQQ